MGSMWLTCFVVNHFLCISVICTDKQNTIHILHRLDCISYQSVHTLDCLDGCRNHTGVSDHIRVCKVDNDHIILV